MQNTSASPTIKVKFYIKLAMDRLPWVFWLRLSKAGNTGLINIKV